MAATIRGRVLLSLIPDPDKDDPCVKKYVVPNGTHNAFLTNPEYYRPEDKDYIINTVKEWLKD